MYWLGHMTLKSREQRVNHGPFQSGLTLVCAIYLRLVWERQGVHEDPKHVFFSYGFSGPKFNVDYGKSCSQAQIKVEQVRNSIFVYERMLKIAPIYKNCP